MTIGDFLYGLTPAEAASAPVLQRRFERVTVSLAGNQVVASSILVPAGKLFRVTHINILGVGGAAQTVTRIQANVIDASAGTVLDIFLKAGAGIGVDGQSMMCDLILFPDEQIQATVDYSAGVAANNTRLSVAGVFFPKGTLQLR